MERTEDKYQDLESDSTVASHNINKAESWSDMLEIACVAEEIHCSVLF